MTSKIKKPIHSSKIIIALGLFILTFSAYFPVCYNSFINFDDGVFVTENRHVNQGINIESLLWAFDPTQKDIKTAYWHPLTWLSHMLDCQFFGLNPALHHVSSLFYHLMNTLLLFLVFAKMTGDVWKSAFISALFALHPINVDSVAWIAQRKNLLSTSFWLLTMLAYFYYSAKPTIIRYSSMLIAFTFGLMSKPMLVTLPCVLLLLDYWPLYRIQWGQRYLTRITIEPSEDNKKFTQAGIIKLILEKLPLLLLAGASTFISTLSHQSHGQVIDHASRSMLLRLENALISYIVYIKKMIWPNDLAVFYPFPGSIPLWKVLSALMLLLVITVFVLTKSKKHPYLITGWLWYLGTLVPVSGLIQAGLWPAMADRFLYVPLIGLFIIIAWGIPEFVEKWKYKKIFKRASAVLLIFAMIGFTRIQLSYWKNDYTLFSHAAKVTKDNYIAHTFTGIYLAEKGQRKEAAAHLSKALSIHPNNKKANQYMADLLYEKGDNEKALKHYFNVLWSFPDEIHTLINIGNIFIRINKPAEAIRYYTQALQIDPSNASIYNNLGIAYYSMGNFNKAVNAYKKAIKINPAFQDAYLNLGMVEEKSGRESEAFTYYQKALKIKPDNAKLQKKIGDALFLRGDLNSAYSYYVKALELNPEDAQILYNMGVICFHTGQSKKAIIHFKDALRINPEYTEAIRALCMAREKK